ncbi:hypothetical protein E2C01_070094 [Portunus trituberculatus]|uniref:Uncharacterized protein n=1 Tax=Portunus trituberculatus TaxID=210409 RepID=A0A5B7HWD9_PORTR|nr:hypothetical protein [Portunus trituberculatus]
MKLAASSVALSTCGRCTVSSVVCRESYGGVGWRGCAVESVERSGAGLGAGGWVVRYDCYLVCAASRDGEHCPPGSGVTLPLNLTQPAVCPGQYPVAGSMTHQAWVIAVLGVEVIRLPACCRDTGMPLKMM